MKCEPTAQAVAALVSDYLFYCDLDRFRLDNPLGRIFAPLLQPIGANANAVRPHGSKLTYHDLLGSRRTYDLL
jgi:hypothetical protein